MQNYSRTIGQAKVFSPAIFQTYFSYHKDIWIAATDVVFYYLMLLLSLFNTLSLHTLSLKCCFSI